MNEKTVALDAQDEYLLNNISSSNRRLSCDGAPSWSLVEKKTILRCPVQQIPRRRRCASRVCSQQQSKPKEEDDEAARARKQADVEDLNRDVESTLITIHRGRRPEGFTFEILLTGRSASDTFNTSRTRRML